jgi:hypothetical protein
MFDPSKKNFLRCNFCGKTYHGGITRIKYHLGKFLKCNVTKCGCVPVDVTGEIVALLTSRIASKKRKATNKKEDRVVVNLGHSEGEESATAAATVAVVAAAADDDEPNHVAMLKRVRSASSSGPIEMHYKLTPEEEVAARKSKGLAEKVQSKLTTQKRDEKRDKACEYICYFFYEASIPHNAVTLPSFDLMLEAIGDFGRNLRGPSRDEMSGRFLQKRGKRVTELFRGHK